jgi:hypothetical protein
MWDSGGSEAIPTYTSRNDRQSITKNGEDYAMRKPGESEEDYLERLTNMALDVLTEQLKHSDGQIRLKAATYLQNRIHGTPVQRLEQDTKTTVQAGETRAWLMAKLNGPTDA